MKVEDIPIDKEIISVLKKHDIHKLYPPQSKALPHIIDGKNMILSIPTASGKSLIAYLGIINKLIKKDGGKALYIVPLKALAKEKFEELKLFENLDIKVGISTGDLDDSDPKLFRYDIIVCTSEKADSLLRHGVSWVNKVKVLVIDEIHLINDPERGPTLEVIISRFKSLNPKTQIIALSATIKNALDLSLWLDGKLIESDWRPIPLKEGVCLGNIITYDNGKTKKLEGEEKKSLNNIVINSINKGGQVLIFVNTRRSTISVANNLGLIIEKTLDAEVKQKLNDVTVNMKRNFSELTSIDKKLFYCIKKGVAFHNAGLSSNQRKIVENEFKNRLIKCIVATPTLAAGINIPAQCVIIRDLWRYDLNFGMRPIPILEYKQQAGRAGRPRYDKNGEAISIAKNDEQKEQILNNYIHGEIEPIFSKLGSKSALRMHLLSSIATNFVDSFDEIYKFIDNTFYAYQSDTFALQYDINETINFLIENGFIDEKNNKFIPTLFGKRTSSLYIDPLSALILKQAIENSLNCEPTCLSFIHAACSTPDVRSLYLRKGDYWVEEKSDIYTNKFLIEKPEKNSGDYDFFLSDLKTSFLISDWINEIPEDGLITKYNIGPGDIHNIVEMVEWILHASREFARMYNYNYVSFLNNLITQVHYGCKKELLNLVSLKGIGRIRARALFNENFKSINDLRKVSVERLSKIKTIGETIAKNIKNQIGQEINVGNRDISEYI
jgi:helicase